jgi:parallel beta-helix repeat protein
MHISIFKSILVVSLLAFLFSTGRIASAAPVTAFLYVAPGGDCIGMSPCYGNPQAAVDAAQSGDIIRIAAGSYLPPSGQTRVLHITKSLILQGGFRPTDWYDMQPTTFPTVLDASHLGSVISIDGDPNQPIHVLLEGIQIKNGQSSQGGGVSGAGVVLSMKRCVVSDNQASGSGGGIYLSSSSSLILESSRVMRNTAGNMGGGIFLSSATGNSSLLRAWIFANSAAAGGGGISVLSGQASLETVMLVDNTVTQPGAAGAGLAANGAAITLSYTTLARNTGGAGSGVSLSGTSTLTAANMLAAGQTAAFSLTTPSTGSVDGVLWGSGTTWANGANTTGSGSVTVQHAYSGDPLIVGVDSANLKTYFHIGASSPARDKSIATAAGYQDIENQRVYNAKADLGADEYYFLNPGTIHVDTEEGGDIEVGSADGIPENSKGAMFWNGSKWVTNDTAAHMFFTEVISFERLMQYTLVADLNASTPAEQDIQGYHVSRSTYTYVALAQGGVYRIEAARYRITRSDSQEIIWLDSRGNGYGQVSFNIYIQTQAGTTIAIRDGSAWFNYSEPPALAAQRSFSDPTGRAGILTSCDPLKADRSRYWVDLNGGSDMGGLTYYFHTSNLPNRTSTLGNCYPDEFRLKYMTSGTNQLEEFRVRPVVYSETFRRMVYLPSIIR